MFSSRRAATLVIGHQILWEPPQLTSDTLVVVEDGVVAFFVEIVEKVFIVAFPSSGFAERVNFTLGSNYYLWLLNNHDFFGCVLVDLDESHASRVVITGFSGVPEDVGPFTHMPASVPAAHFEDNVLAGGNHIVEDSEGYVTHPFRCALAELLLGDIYLLMKVFIEFAVVSDLVLLAGGESSGGPVE